MSFPDWSALFVPKVSLLEIVIRGTVVYIGLLLMFRFLLKRQAGALGMTDLLVIVMIADAAQNAMAAEYNSLTEGFLLVATIMFWCYFLDWLGTRVPAVGRMLHPPPLELVRDGKLIRRNMQQELITKEELMSQLREQGVEEIEEVKRACMEGDGRISVVKKDGESQGKDKGPTV